MATLTTKARNKLPASKFALSGERYPVEDKAHARAALSRVSHAAKVGNVTPAEAAKVRHKAEHVLGETDSTYHNTPGR